MYDVFHVIVKVSSELMSSMSEDVVMQTGVMKTISHFEEIISKERMWHHCLGLYL